MIRVGIANDSAVAIEAIRKALVEEPRLQTAWVAYDGAQTVEKAAEDTPDVILMDLLMPKVDGVEATKRIMRDNPCSILVVSATLDGDYSGVFDAMGAGALDACAVPRIGPDGSVSGSRELNDKILLLGKLGQRLEQTDDLKSPHASNSLPTPIIVAVGASTGGPKALETILKNLEYDSKRFCIILVQHVDDQFVSGLVEWMSERAGFEVKIAEKGESPVGGKIYVSKADFHLSFDRLGRFDYSEEPIDYPYKPSINLFFESLAESRYKKVIAAILTGMGTDGAEGLLKLKKAGRLTVAQDRASSAVYGMPKKAAEIDAADMILPPEEIAVEIMQFVNK